jgi:hypothetical protein
VSVASEQKKPVLFKDISASRIYARVHRAKWNLEADTVHACTSHRVSTSVDETHQALILGRSKLPYTIQQVGEETTERFITLYFQGQRYDRETKQLITSRGKVLMVKEEGTWRIRHEDWEDISSEPFVGDPPY